MNDFDGGVLDVCHVFAVRVFSEEGGGANNDVNAIDASLDRDFGIGHITADMSEDLGLETELADGFTVLARLLTGGWGGEFDVVGAKLVQSPCDFNLFGGVEVGIGESGESEYRSYIVWAREVTTDCSPSLSVLSII